MVLFLKQSVHSWLVSTVFPSRAYRKYDLFQPTKKKNSLARNNHHIINIYVLCLQNLTTCIPFTPDYEHAVNLFFNINYTFCIQRAYINIFFLLRFRKSDKIYGSTSTSHRFFNNVTRIKLLEDMLYVFVMCVWRMVMTLKKGSPFTLCRWQPDKNYLC